MRGTRPYRAVAVAVLAAFLLSCASTNIPPISSAEAPYEPAKDERRLWEQARIEEQKLRQEAPLYNDPLLEDYLAEVVGRLNPPAMAANQHVAYRVSVVKAPTLNAFAYPHGSLYIHTGLLARMENEDQLATVLGHEMTHVENRHMLRFQRSARNKQLGFSIAAIAGALILAGEEGEEVRAGHYGKAARIRVIGDLLLGLGLTLAIIAAMNGYGRNLEREADEGGMQKLAATGYDVRQAHEIYEELLEEHGDPGTVEVFFFGSHPKMSARIDAVDEWVTANPGAVQARRAGDPDEFRRRIRPVIREDARLNMERGRLQMAEWQLNRVLDEMPRDAEAHYLMGELLLTKADGEQDPRAKEQFKYDAMASFMESIRLDPKRPAPRREAGLLALRSGDTDTACRQLDAYIDLDPHADDAQIIRDYMLELNC